ncbi:MAG: hypothetical protein OEN01_02465 [Candidatus Krumholzibacteria bacterium]|nr:hypothetical protein [Candidatus Krumholzibacteria bacterium]
MRLPMLVAVFFLLVLAAASRADTRGPFIADAPEQIRPLMIGVRVPDVTLVTPDHQPVVLRDVLAIQPTILIYYRGGW